jgi:hypothetical protein
MRRRRRWRRIVPFGILVLGIAAIIAGIFSVFWGFALTGAGGMSWLTGLIVSSSLQFWGSNAMGAGLTSMLLGVVEVIAGFGLLARRPWARFLALIGTGAGMIGPAISMAHGDGWALFGFLLNGAIFFYLLLDQDVRAAFSRNTRIPV